MTLVPQDPHFSPTFETWDYVFISGQLAFDAEGEIEGDVARQTETCLANMEALLAGRGLDRYDIVKTTVWLRHAEDYATFNETYAHFFGGHRPARSTVVCGLAHPRAIVEIEAIAILSPAPRGPVA